MNRLTRRWLAAGALGTAVLGLAAGCGSKETKATAEVARPNSRDNPLYGIPVAKGGKSVVKGKVTVGDEAVVGGRVLFLAEDGICMAVGIVNAEGAYSCPGLPDGRLHLAVLLDPDGEVPFPKSAASEAPKAGGPLGKSGPPADGPEPGRPPGVGRRGKRDTDDALGMPEPFVQKTRFRIPADMLAKYKPYHARSAKFGKTSPPTVTVAGTTVCDIVLK